MRELYPSQHDFQQLKALYEKIVYYISGLKLFKTPPNVEDELKAIHAVFSVIYLSPLVFVTKDNIQNLILNKIHELFHKIPKQAWPKFDESMRETQFWKLNLKSYESVGQIVDASSSPNCLKKLNFQANFKITLLQIYACHHNGFIRQEAIKQLAKLNPQAGFGVFLIRADDWVEPISTLAQQLIHKYVNSIPPGELVSYLPLIERLSIKQRFMQSDAILKLKQVLINNGAQQLLRFIKKGEKGSRYAFQLWSGSSLPIQDLIDTAIQSGDLILKLRSIDIAEQNLTKESCIQFLKQHHNHSSSIIRRKIIHLYTKLKPNDYIDFLRSKIFDEISSIRNTARFYLRQEGISNFLELYKLNLNGVKKTILIEGIAECGHSEDFAFLETIYDLNSIPETKAMIYALFRLKPENWKSKIKDYQNNLSDQNLKPLQENLKRYHEEFTHAEIVALIEPQNDDHHLNIYLKICRLRGVDRWLILNFCLALMLKTINVSMQDKIELYLNSWIQAYSPNRIFTRPNQDILNSCIEKTEKLIQTKKHNAIYTGLKATLQHFC